MATKFVVDASSARDTKILKKTNWMGNNAHMKSSYLAPSSYNTSDTGLYTPKAVHCWMKMLVLKPSLYDSSGLELCTVDGPPVQ